ncbi:MAG: AhpC/TSA family protein [Prevotellaceae bacterium]|jgi:thiol-disulfide isomerase/thioredoxin|nr:AhpC/TSA family protein [Prevotellaceae bacterium]
MKQLISILSVFLLFISCNDSNSHKIKGQLSSDNLDGQTIYLKDYLSFMNDRNSKPIDSAVIKKDRFTLTFTNVEHPIFALLTDDNQKASAVVFVENANIKVKIDLDNPQKTSVSGSELNDLWAVYLDSIRAVNDKFTELMQYAQSKEQTPEFEAELMARQKAIIDGHVAFSGRFIKDHPGNILTAFILRDIAGQGGLSVEEIQSAYDQLDENVRNNEIGQSILKGIEREKTQAVAVGELFRDLSMKTPEGKDISISDFAGKGKYVLLDFWASWCSPCRAENPNIVALYNEYKDKGFEIVGISLDNDKDAWIKGIEDDKITWSQMSDLKGWESPACVKYKVSAIPFTLLLDKEGKVIEINPRGEVLKSKLKELLN